MKKRKPQRQKPRPPMLVLRHLHTSKIEIHEVMAVQAFAKGFATKHHYDTILDMQGVMLMAGETAPHRKYAKDYANNVIGPVILNIKARYDKTGKLGVSAYDLAHLREFLQHYKEFWARQPTELYMEVCQRLQSHYQNMKDDAPLIQQPATQGQS